MALMLELALHRTLQRYDGIRPMPPPCYHFLEQIAMLEVMCGRLVMRRCGQGMASVCCIITGDAGRAWPVYAAATGAFGHISRYYAGGSRTNSVKYIGNVVKIGIVVRTTGAWSVYAAATTKGPKQVMRTSTGPKMIRKA